MCFKIQRFIEIKVGIGTGKYGVGHRLHGITVGAENTVVKLKLPLANESVMLLSALAMRGAVGIDQQLYFILMGQRSMRQVESSRRRRLFFPS